MIRRFLPLAQRLAARYRSPNEPLEEIVQVACIGLLYAIDHVDTGRSVVPVLGDPDDLGELERHFRNTGWAVRVPRATQELALRVQKTTREITDQRGRSPQIDELAEVMTSQPQTFAKRSRPATHTLACRSTLRSTPTPTSRRRPM